MKRPMATVEMMKSVFERYLSNGGREWPRPKKDFTVSMTDLDALRGRRVPGMEDEIDDVRLEFCMERTPHSRLKSTKGEV